MLTGIDLSTLSFAEPLYLWLLLVPAMLLVLWLWQVWRRRLDARRCARDRVLPVRERFTIAGDLAFWLCVIVAASLCSVALARPQARVSAVTTAGADIVILQDGSASMWTRDVRPDRWQRSVQFIRAFAEALSWKGDRVALAIFAHLASPQTRLTKDPNALFFFLDHLSARSPFRLEDDPTWDTNIEEGLYWGLKLVETDEQLFGKTTNAKAFVVISDGQSWSGNVATALAMARERQTAVYVVGVGTTTGGLIPEPVRSDSGVPHPPIRAVLDRDSLRAIARVGEPCCASGHSSSRDQPSCGGRPPPRSWRWRSSRARSADPLPIRLAPAFTQIEELAFNFSSDKDGHVIEILTS